MEARALERMTWWMRGVSLPLVALAFGVRGVDGALGAFAGAALALGNWALVSWFCEALLRRSDAVRGRVMALVAVKSGFVMMIAAALLRVFDPTGLVLGVSALVLGIVGGAVHTAAREPDSVGIVPSAIAGEKD